MKGVVCERLEAGREKGRVKEGLGMGWGLGDGGENVTI